MWRKLRSLVTFVLMLPIMPCFMWGPVTHPFIAYQAYEKAKKDLGKTANPDIMDAIEGHKETYVYASNSPDAISTNHILFNIVTYDYAHNNIPDHADGSPVFGYRLVAKALERLHMAGKRDRQKCERELAFACGWLTHQVSDWVAHYMGVHREIRQGEEVTFNGYANSHQVLSPYFHRDILFAKREAEHALTEFFHDAHVMLTDTVDMFAPGRIRVELPIQEDDNLISLVSETFHDSGYSKIPAKHLKKLEEDFQVVIKGIQAGILFVNHIQPRFKAMAKEFSNNNQGFIDKSIDRVIELVLSPTVEHIKEETQTPARGGTKWAASVISAKPESVIHRFAFNLGKVMGPDMMDVLFKDPIARFKWELRFFPSPYIELSLRDRIRKLLPGELEKFGGRAESTRALVRFASELISASDNILDRARDMYCSKLRPVTTLDVPQTKCESTSVDEILAEMIDDGIIRIRFTPAKRTDKDKAEYLLNEESAVIRVNGYQHGEENAPFTVALQWDETKEVLQCEVRLDEKAKTGDCIHIFADINDMRGEHSQYIDKQVMLGVRNR
jgi:hypothetical protein